MYSIDTNRKKVKKKIVVGVKFFLSFLSGIDRKRKMVYNRRYHFQENVIFTEMGACRETTDQFLK